MSAGSAVLTVEFKVNLLAPVSGGELEAVAEIVSMTKSTAVVRIDVRNEGRTCAAAQGTVTIRPPREKKSG